MLSALVDTILLWFFGRFEIFKEFDLVYLNNDMLFWGARNVDGRGFDTEANRPTNLQIPMVRE